MADDNAVEFIKIKDDSQYQRDGTLLKVRTYVFFIGKHGPFTESVPLEPFDPNAIERTVANLRTHLTVLPK